MAIEARQRPQQSMHFLPQDSMAPQFTNPWASQEQMNDAATNLHALGKPTIRTSSPFLNGNTAALASNNVRQLSSPPSSYPNPSGLLPNMNGAQTAFTTADMSMPSSTAPSPTTAGANFVPSFTSPMDLSVPPRSQYPDRRLSQPAMSSSLFLGADLLPKQRQASLTDFPYRPRNEFDFNSDALDSARGMVVMSQAPTSQRPRGDGSHSFPSSHSASSSISSSHSFPYYNGGSVDSSATDYSDAGNFPGELRQPTLPRPNGYVNTGATVPNQMMTTFSSKITSSTQKKHKCKVCDKRFTRPSSLQTHTYSHTGEKRKIHISSAVRRKANIT